MNAGTLLLHQETMDSWNGLRRKLGRPPTYVEFGREMGITPGAARSRIYRARRFGRCDIPLRNKSTSDVALLVASMYWEFGRPPTISELARQAGVPKGTIGSRLYWAMRNGFLTSGGKRFPRSRVPVWHLLPSSARSPTREQRLGSAVRLMVLQAERERWGMQRLGEEALRFARESYLFREPVSA